MLALSSSLWRRVVLRQQRQVASQGVACCIVCRRRREYTISWQSHMTFEPRHSFMSSSIASFSSSSSSSSSSPASSDDNRSSDDAAARPEGAHSSAAKEPIDPVGASEMLGRTLVKGGKLRANVVEERQWEMDLSGIEEGQMLLQEELNAALEANELSEEDAKAMERVLSYMTANQQELMRQRIQNLIVQYQTHPGDTGSPGVAIAVLSEKIANLERHLKEHSKDIHSKRVINKYLHRRRALLRYLRHRNAQGAALYEQLLVDFNIDRAWLNNFGRIPGRQVFTTPQF